MPKWMIVVGVLVILAIGGLVFLWSQRGAIVQAGLDTPEGKRGFVTSFKKSCGDGFKQAAGQISATAVDGYCDCAATQVLEKIKGQDMADLTAAGMTNSMTPELQQKLAAAVQPCQSKLQQH